MDFLGFGEGTVYELGCCSTLGIDALNTGSAGVVSAFLLALGDRGFGLVVGVLRLEEGRIYRFKFKLQTL